MSSPPVSYSVLCVDDEPSGLNLRQLILERKGYLVSTARTASEGLALFKAKEFDLVVTDHLLGRDTGTAMAKEMKRLSPFVPIIVLSGATDTPEGIEIADAFLSKAEGPERLLTKVHEFVTRSRAARASGSADPSKEETAFLDSFGDPSTTGSHGGVIRRCHLQQIPRWNDHDVE